MNEIKGAPWLNKDHIKYAQENVEEIEDLDNLNLFKQDSFKDQESKDEEDDDKVEPEESSGDWKDLVPGLEKQSEN